MYRKALVVVFCLIGVGFFGAQESHAASLSTLSDTVSTSRPSAAAPLVAAQAAGDGQATITDNNAVFLQNDSATFFADPNGGGETTDLGVTVASMSAANTPSSSQRIVYLTTTVTHKHHIGDAVVVPITAMHTVSFKPITSIPIGGKIIISFPALAAADTNPASPSASAFQFNGLSNTNIQFNFSNSTTCTTVTVSGISAGSTPTITCTTATAVLTGGAAVTVTVLIGCSAHTGAACTTQVPTLINPMRKQPPGANAGQGVGTTQADNWKISVTTQDASSVNQDTGTAVIGTIESVLVQATIDPTLTFQIIGVADATTVNNAFVTGCPNSSSDVTNAGIATLATNVNLGTVGTGLTIAAQKAVVSTNGSGGYVLTATASGQLTDSTVGHSVTSSTTPGAITGGTENFGIHPCGSDVTSATTTWNNGGNGTQTSLTAGTGFVGWPSATTALQLANHAGTASSATTAIEYGITASVTTPAGFYTGVITYVATPTFN